MNIQIVTKNEIELHCWVFSSSLCSSWEAYLSDAHPISHPYLKALKKFIFEKGNTFEYTSESVFVFGDSDNTEIWFSQQGWLDFLKAIDDDDEECVNEDRSEFTRSPKKSSRFHASCNMVPYY